MEVTVHQNIQNFASIKKNSERENCFVLYAHQELQVCNAHQTNIETQNENILERANKGVRKRTKK